MRGSREGYRFEEVDALTGSMESSETAMLDVTFAHLEEIHCRRHQRDTITALTGSMESSETAMTTAVIYSAVG